MEHGDKERGRDLNLEAPASHVLDAHVDPSGDMPERSGELRLAQICTMKCSMKLRMRA